MVDFYSPQICLEACHRTGFPGTLRYTKSNRDEVVRVEIDAKEIHFFSH